VKVEKPRIALRNLRLATATGSGRDAIGVWPGADNVLIERVTIPHNGDEGIGVWKASGARITIHRCDIGGGGRAILINGDTTHPTRVTISESKLHAHQRNPLVKDGHYAHLFGCWLPSWGIYGAGMETRAQMLIEACLFAYGGSHRARAHVPNSSGADHDVWLRAENNWYANGASGRTLRPEGVPTPWYGSQAAQYPGPAFVAQHVAEVAGARI